jgi:sirohydrochlorin ferrochelatase
VFDALDEHGIPREWVIGVNPDTLDVVLALTDLEEDAVYDVEEQVYVQKTEVAEDEKYARLQGLADRIDELEGSDAGAFREELRQLEERLDEALSA